MRFNRKVSKNEQNRTKLKQTLVVKLKMTLIKERYATFANEQPYFIVTDCNYSILLPSLPLRSREESCTSCRFHRWVLVEKNWSVWRVCIWLDLCVWWEEYCFLRGVCLGFPASPARDLGVIRSAVTSGVTWTPANLTLRDTTNRSFSAAPFALHSLSHSLSLSLCLSATAAAAALAFLFLLP